MKIFRSVVTNEKNVGVELGKSVSIDAPHKRLRKLDFYKPLRKKICSYWFLGSFVQCLNNLSQPTILYFVKWQKFGIILEMKYLKIGVIKKWQH